MSVASLRSSQPDRTRSADAAPSLWESAAAAARAVAARSDPVALVLQPSRTFQDMLAMLGPGWDVRHGPNEADAIDEKGKVITVRDVTDDPGPRPGDAGPAAPDAPATAAKIVASVAEVLRRREIRGELPAPNPGEPEETFVERFLAVRADIEAAYYVRILGVTSDLTAAGLRTDLVARTRVVEGGEPAPDPLILPVTSVTPGITANDLARYADLLGGEEGRALIFADIAGRPAAEAAFRAEAATLRAWSA